MLWTEIVNSFSGERWHMSVCHSLLMGLSPCPSNAQWSTPSRVPTRVNFNVSCIKVIEEKQRTKKGIYHIESIFIYQP